MTRKRDQLLRDFGVDPDQPFGQWVRAYPSQGHKWHGLRNSHTTLCGRQIDLHRSRNWVPPREKCCTRCWDERTAR